MSPDLHMPSATEAPAAPLPPGRIEECLDPSRVGPLLIACLRAHGEPHAELDRLDIHRVRRSASKLRHPHPLTLVYELSLRASRGPGQPRRFYGKLHRPGAIDAATLPAQAWHLEALDLLLWPWPADPGLPQLAALLDPACTPRAGGPPADEVEVLRHEPETRALLAYTRRGAPAGERLFAKTYAQARAPQVAARFAYLAAQAAIDPQAPRVADTLGSDPEGHTLWQREVLGKVFDPLRQVPRAEDCEALARALAAVHRAPLSLAGSVPRDRAHWRQELGRRHRKLLRVAPGSAPEVERLHQQLDHAAAHLPEPPLRLIHGDCHPGQYWWQGDRVVVFDLDEMCLGDPMEDLAEFIVGLERVDDRQGWGPALTQAYARLEPTNFDAPRLHWHRAMQHLLQASRAFVYQAPGWETRARHQLRQALQAAEALSAEIRP